MCQILHTRNSGEEGFLTLQQPSASVSNEEKERVQHTPTLDDWLIAIEGLSGGSGHSSGILAPPPLLEILIISLLFF